jgi:hypothetical protein
MNRGWKETIKAAGLGWAAAGIIAIVVALVALSGCAGSSLLAEYEHHSSAQDLDDLATADMVGLVFSTPIRLRPSDCSRYCPELEMGLHWEITNEPVFGRDPVGTIRLRQPIYLSRE